MKYSIVYSSKTGNTLALAECIKASLSEDERIYFGVPSDEALQADKIYIGFWTDKGTCDNQTADFLKKLSNQQIFLYGTAGFGGSESYFKKILSNVKENINENCIISGEYMCQGKMPYAVRKRYEEMPDSEQKNAMLANFDLALEHPNDDDLKKLKELIINNQ